MVAVVGDALLDVLARPAGPMRRGADVPALIGLAPGGQAANLAVRLARRGVDVELVCALADDPAGRLVRAALAVEGVRVNALPAPATGSVVVLVDGAGERTMLSQRTPFADGVAGGLPTGPDWLVTSGHLLLEGGADAAARAMRHGAPLRALVGCAVPDDRLDAWRAAAELLDPDLVILNRDEASRLPSFATDRLVVTDARGATAVIGEARAEVVDPHAGSVAVDTTGAGDAFAATLVAALRDAWPPTAEALGVALAEAAANAAAVAGVAGAQGRIASERWAGRRS